MHVTHTDYIIIYKKNKHKTWSKKCKKISLNNLKFDFLVKKKETGLVEQKKCKNGLVA